MASWHRENHIADIFWCEKILEFSLKSFVSDRIKKPLSEFELRENMEVLSFLLQWDFCRVLIFLHFPRTRILLPLKCKLSWKPPKFGTFCHPISLPKICHTLSLTFYKFPTLHVEVITVLLTILLLVFHPSRESEEQYSFFFFSKNLCS